MPPEFARRAALPWLALALLLLGGCSGAGAPDRAAQPFEPTLLVEPAAGPCGTPVRLSGAGYPPRRTVEVVGPSIGGVAVPGMRRTTTTTGADGTFTVLVEPCQDPAVAPPELRLLPGRVVFFAAYTLPADASIVSARVPFRLADAPPAAPPPAPPAAGPPASPPTPTQPAAPAPTSPFAPTTTPTAIVTPAGGIARQPSVAGTPGTAEPRERLPVSGEPAGPTAAHRVLGVAGFWCLLLGLDLRRRAGSPGPGASRRRRL